MGSSKKITPRKFIVYVLSLAVLSLARPTPVLFAVGLVLVIMGELMRIWGCGHLQKNQDVIMSGPFAYVKNPLYVGTFLIVVGFCLQASNPAEPSRYILYLILPLFLAIFFLYYFPYKVRVEGERLKKRFGEKFEEYDRNVPEFIPRLTPYGGSKVKWDMSLLSENSEWGILFVVLAGSALIFTKFFPFSEIYDLWRVFG
jgi:protein-S-isoprenylcysteine O-methyltransferase Ste14